MHHIICYFDWKAAWWQDQATFCSLTPSHLQHGLYAYAHRQPAMYEGLGLAYSKHWYGFLVAQNIPILWLPKYISVTDQWYTYLVFVVYLNYAS